MAEYEVIAAVTHYAPGATADKGPTRTPLGIRLAGNQLVMSAASYEKYKEAMGLKSKNWIGFEPGSGLITLPGDIFTKHPGVPAKDPNSIPLDPVWIMASNTDNEKAVRAFLKEKCALTLT